MTPATIPARAAKRLWDAREAAEAAQRFTAGLTDQAFNENDLVQSAVERQFEILGEALNAARREFPESVSLVPGLPRWVGLRNLLAHRYDDIRSDALMRIVRIDLPPLISALTAALANAERP